MKENQDNPKNILGNTKNTAPKEVNKEEANKGFPEGSYNENSMGGKENAIEGDPDKNLEKRKREETKEKKQD